MNIFPRQIILPGLITVALALLLVLGIQTPAAADSPPPEPELISISNTAHPEAGMASLTPPPQQDPCLHCHIKGEEKGLWTPTARWAIFGTAGLIFLFGVVRSASTWKARQPWRSVISRGAEWVDGRYGVSEPLKKVLSKPVPNWQRRWWYCLGGLTAFAFIIQGITGIMLAFYYKPTPEAAYASIQFIENQVYFGAGIRMIHHWSANFMIVLCFAHMLRVFINGAYKPPRELNWASGVILFAVTLGFGFTGYLLPWDQRAFWATTVGTEIAGGIPAIGDLALVLLRVGWDISDLTLTRFYSLHIIILPLITLIMMGLHFLMVRKQGIMKPL